MSDANETGSVTQPTVEQPQAETKPKKVFTRDDVRSSIKVSVTLPRLYEGYDPWEFLLRIKLSTAAEEKRQEFLSLAPALQAEKTQEQNLLELCDLLKALPKGFGDLKDNGTGPGPSFREYVETCPSAEMKTMLYTIVEGAVNLYWRTIMPVEFRKQV
jgi:hypothetical protein